MKIRPQTAIVLSILFVLAGILGSWALGWWQTQTDRTPQRLESQRLEDMTSPSQAGGYDPDDIRGSYTFEDINRFYEVPLADLAAAFTVDTDRAAGFKVKDFETIFPDPDGEIGTSSMKLFVAWYKGLPYELKEESFLPAPAAAILREKAEITLEQEEYLNTHTLETQE